jgi:hypothetical protein
MSEIDWSDPKNASDTLDLSPLQKPPQRLVGAPQMKPGWLRRMLDEAHQNHLRRLAEAAKSPDAVAVDPTDPPVLHATLLPEKDGGVSVQPSSGPRGREGEVRPLPGKPGQEMTFQGGRWIRTK